MYPGPLPPQAPPPAAGGARIGPAKSWFVVAGVIAVAGIVAAVVVLVVGIMGYVDRVDDLDRAELPATLEVEITDTGGYSIYHEYDGAYDDGSTRFVSDPVVSVTDPSGDDVVLDRYVGSITYEANGHEGEGLFTFDAEVPGTYEVTASGEPGSGIAVGRGLGRGLVVTIVGGLAIGFVGVVAGVVMAIVVGVRRSRNRRALLPAPHFAGWGPGPGPVAPRAYAQPPPPPPPPPPPTDAAPAPRDAPPRP